MISPRNSLIILGVVAVLSLALCPLIGMEWIPLSALTHAAVDSVDANIF